MKSEQINLKTTISGRPAMKQALTPILPECNRRGITIKYKSGLFVGLL